jgi:hypothetical protein
MPEVLGLAGLPVHPALTERIRNRCRKAGITAEQYLALFDAGCPICFVHFRLPGTRQGSKANLDHDHRISAVLCPASFRGLLCSKCNMAEGFYAHLSDDDARAAFERMLAHRGTQNRP